MVSEIFARLVSIAIWRSRLTLTLAFLTAAACIAFSARHLPLNSDENDLFSGELEMTQRRADFYEALPMLADPIIVVIERTALESSTTRATASPDAAMDALVARIAADPARFHAVYGWPRVEFRSRHGALYVPEEELSNTLDRIVRIQPILGALSRDPGLAGMLRTLRRLVDASGSEAFDETRDRPVGATNLMESICAEIAAVIAAWVQEAPGTVDWTRVFPSSMRSVSTQRQVIFVTPVTDHSSMDPAGPAIAELRTIIATLPGVAAGELSVRLTGVPVLAHEDGEHVAAQAGLAGVASLLLVIFVLARGLGSWRLLAGVAVTLLVSICWTAGLAAILVGHLNVISIAFVVLCIGLGVDFALHYALCVVAAYADAGGARQALFRCGRAIGPTLALCTTTTAAAFLAFSLTDFKAMAELGVIMAGGMLASLLATFTVLPALMARLSTLPEPRPLKFVRAARHIVEVRPVATLAIFVVMAAASAGLLPQLRFDASPLSVRDPSADSVRVLRALLDAGDGVTWNMNVLLPEGREGAAIAARLRALPSVAEVRTPAGYLPQDQARKLGLIDSAALAMTPESLLRARPHIDVGDVRNALVALADTLDERDADGGSRCVVSTAVRGGLAEAAREAERRLSSLEASTASSSLADLESRLLGGLERQMDAIDTLLATQPVELEDLPPELAPFAQSRDGRLRLEVLPSADLTDRNALARFVNEVLDVAPDAFGEAFTIHRLGHLVINAFALATAVAFGAVVALVWIAHRSARATLLVIAPLALACLLTLGACVLLGISLNFANVIVLPLLLGIGVDTSIHLVHRALAIAGPQSVLESQSARAVVLSGLTTLASFGSLALSRHLGLSSLGQLLCLGLLCVLASNLLFLPALLRVILPGRRCAP